MRLASRLANSCTSGWSRCTPAPARICSSKHVSITRHSVSFINTRLTTRSAAGRKPGANHLRRLIKNQARRRQSPLQPHKPERDRGQGGRGEETPAATNEIAARASYTTLALANEVARRPPGRFARREP